MKKLLLVSFAVCFVATVAYAATATKTEGAVMEVASPTVTTTTTTTTTEVVAAQELALKGVIVDTMCAGAHKADLGEFIKTHPKSCALMPDCAASGYNLVSDGVLMKFDDASSAKVAEFLKKEDSSLKVEVVVKKVGEELSLVSIVNQVEAKEIK